MAKNEPARSRAQTGQTQQQAADVLGVAMRTWQDWERGINAMPPYALRLYRHITGLERIPFRSKT
jgi:DNA-binding transcriptional regulator YiaG